MDDTTLTKIISVVPERYRNCALIAVALFPWVTRYLSGLKQGGGIVGSFKAILFGSATLTPKAPNDAPSRSVAGPLAVLLLACGLCFGGCAWVKNGNNSLAPGGAYAPIDVTVVGGISTTNVLRAPDYVFFEVDSAFDLAESSIQGVFKFERDNRPWLWSISPDIKKTLDRMRPGTWAVITKYTKARAAYKANPTPANLATLEGLTGQIKTLVDIAIAVLPQNLSTKPATNN